MMRQNLTDTESARKVRNKMLASCSQRRKISRTSSSLKKKYKNAVNSLRTPISTHKIIQAAQDLP